VINQPIPTPKRVKAIVAHASGFLDQNTKALRIVIEGTIVAKDQSVDWQATAESLGDQLLEAWDQQRKEQREIYSLQRDVDDLHRELRNAILTEVETRERLIRIKDHWAVEWLRKLGLRIPT